MLTPVGCEPLGLLDCNIQIFKNALTEVFNMSKKSAFAAAAKVHKPSPSLDSRTLGSSQRGGGPGGKGMPCSCCCLVGLSSWRLVVVGK
jgi:hypothetical protein